VYFPLYWQCSVCCRPHRVATEPALFDIQIHLQIDQSITRKVLIADVQDEAERIWRPYGVRITWPDSKSPAEPFSVTAILAWEIERSGVLGTTADPWSCVHRPHGAAEAADPCVDRCDGTDASASPAFLDIDRRACART
jgi:hypothetical protein